MCAMTPRNSWSRSPEGAVGTLAEAGRSPYPSRVRGLVGPANRPVLRTGAEVCIVVQVAEPQGTVTVALIGSDSGETKMNFELHGSTQRCRVDIRRHGESQDEKCTLKRMPPVNMALFVGCGDGCVFVV